MISKFHCCRQILFPLRRIASSRTHSFLLSNSLKWARFSFNCIFKVIANVFHSWKQTGFDTWKKKCWCVHFDYIKVGQTQFEIIAKTSLSSWISQARSIQTSVIHTISLQLFLVFLCWKIGWCPNKAVELLCYVFLFQTFSGLMRTCLAVVISAMALLW